MGTPKIPGYEILAELPHGGMSVVFKARQLCLNRIVALKTLPSDLISDTADIEQFLTEARLTANLNHPNIVQVYEFGKSEDGVYYFAMNYITGYTVASWINRKGFLSETDTLLVAQTITDALDYAWQKSGIIHCDIKPANVIVDGDGTIKVTDLGLAQSMDHMVDRKKTDEDMIAGTPEYMAPEQVSGNCQLDSRVDIYALGAMMYHCLTGKTPFDGRPPTDIVVLQETGFISDPQDIRPDLSVAIACLVETFMAKDRGCRHAGWGEVRQDIKRVSQGQLPERILPSEGISTVMRSPARARHIEEMKRVLPPPRAAPPVYYDLFHRNDQAIARKTAKKQALPPISKWAFAGLVAVAVVFAGFILRYMPSFKSSRAVNPTITASGNSSPVPELATVPSPTPSLLPSRAGECNPRAMLETAVEWARTNNTCYDDVIGKFKQVAEQTRGTPQAITATEELGKWVGLKQQAVEAEMKVIGDKAADMANQGRLLDAAKLLDDYSGPWHNETLTERGRRAIDYRNRYAETDRLLQILMNNIVGNLLQGELDAAENQIQDALQDVALASRRPDLSKMMDQLNRIRRADEWIINSFEPQVGQEIMVQFQDVSQRLLIREVSANRVIAEQNAEKNKGRIIVHRSFNVLELSLKEREARVAPDGAPETVLLRGWLLWQAGDWPGAEKQWAKTNAGLSQALLDNGREQHKGKESKTVTAIPSSLTQTNSLSTPAPSSLTVAVKRGSDLKWLQDMLLKNNPKLAPEQITAQIEDGKVVRLEIISLNVRDISAVSELTDLQTLVCAAFKSDENLDSAKSAPLEDLTPLKGVRLRELNLFGTRVKDLAPLQDMPLEALNIGNTNVKNLKPLMNLPLKSLNIKQTAARDLNPIMKLPIERIWLDFNPAKIRRETDREFWKVLSRMPSLKFINDRTVAEFNF